MGTHPTQIALLIGSLCSLSIIAPAVAADETRTANVDEHIVVIGRADKTPLNIAANVNVIDAAAIEMSGATNLTDVLRGQSGIQISDNNIGTSF
ncbi:MAG: TonB-dependent receptor plug domain-containing protein, partial [Shewanella oncorhynchi]